MSKQKTRYIIYVDASGAENNTEFKISLYDRQTNATFILALGENVQDSTRAELYAIVYAIMYTNKHKIPNVMILCDNTSAVRNPNVQNIARLFNIELLWIPREINEVADRISKLEPTQKDKELYLLEMFISTIEYAHISDTDHAKTQEIATLKEQIKIKNEKIKNQTTQLNVLRNKK